MKRYLILLMVGVAISSQAENLYTFKDSNGQVLLTSIVNNGQSSKTINHAETETLKSEKQDDGGEYYTGDVSSDIEVLNQQAQQREDHLANSRYVFKDSKGQVLLTNVVNNGKPAGENFTRFTQKVKVTYYPDTNVHAYSSWYDITKQWENMTDKQILQSVENPTDKNGNALELSSDEKQRQLKYAKEYIYERNLAKKPAAKIGMTKNQVRNQTNWGEPNSINKTVTAYGTIEQWIYDDYQYLYFKNGKLTTIQTHE